MENSGTPTNERAPRWQVWLVFLAGVSTLAFGAVGNYRYELLLHPGANPDGFSVLYHTAQLFILHAPHLEHHSVPCELHAGRLSGAVFVFMAGVIAVFKFFRQEWLTFRLRLPGRSGHVVICGLGDLGLRLAIEGRRKGEFIVAVEKPGNRGALDQARANGVLAFEGDAADLKVLRSTRVERAKFLVAACGDDQTNIAVAAKASGLIGSGADRTDPLICRLMINDPQLRQLFAQDPSALHVSPHYHVNLGDLDLYDTIARQALRHHPLDFRPIGEHDDTVVNLVVIGFCPVGQTMARHAARIAHFANEVGKGIQPHITVIDAAPQPGWAAFQVAHPYLNNACVIDFKPLDPTQPTFADDVVVHIADAGSGSRLTTYAVCLPDDAANLRVGLQLAGRLANQPVQILIHESTRSGFAALFPPEGGGLNASVRPHPFGMLEDVYAWDVLLHESEDKLAAALHEEYRRLQRDRGKEEPAWSELNDGLKDSNRQAADHIAVKLRAIGYHAEPLRQDQKRKERFDPDEILLLAKLEHIRWCAERWVANWTYAEERSREKKQSPCLVPWDELPGEEKKNDISQVEAIPQVLNTAGLGIYR